MADTLLSTQTQQPFENRQLTSAHLSRGNAPYFNPCFRVSCCNRPALQAKPPRSSGHLLVDTMQKAECRIRGDRRFFLHSSFCTLHSSFDMPNFNRVILIGNLTADPQPRPTPSGKPLTTFRLAVNHTFKNKQGNMDERVCFVDVATWGTLAQTCAKSLKKGKAVFVEGRLEQSTWEKDAQVHSKLQIHALKVLFLFPPEPLDPIDDLPEPAQQPKSQTAS